MNQRVSFVCPLCKGPLIRQPDAYLCAHDQQRYRIVYGIPDFRVFPDPYISVADEDRKTARIMAEYPRRTFAQLVEFYYSITDDVSPPLASKYMRFVFSGVERGEATLDAVARAAPAAPHGALLEVGCGTAGLLVAAAGRYDETIGVDIALRWLVIARKRLEETKSRATLVCACAEHLPFPSDAFDAAIASDVLEHTRSALEAAREAQRVLRPAAPLFIATPNRWTLAPDAHMQLWGLGFLPPRWRDAYVLRTRHKKYPPIHTLNFFELRRIIRAAGFARWRMLMPEFHPAHRARLSRWERAGIPLYRALLRLPLFKAFVYLFGPLYHVICFKSAEKKS